jgi:hypothetical protein
MSAASWDSNDNTHRALLRPVAEFRADSFRRKDHQNGVVLILGKHESDNTVLRVQSVVFDKDSFPAQADAKAWFNDNSNSVDKTYDARSGTKLDAKGIKGLGGINKRVVAVHAAPENTGELTAAVREPDESQLELINTYTRTPKTADQVAVFPVLACNDIIDRDQDQFTAETVAGFMALEGTLSPLGKSFMVGHNYQSLPVGRIFDGEAIKQDGVNWLRLWTYIPNTPQYQAYLENVDFGVYWAVSVGVMLGGAQCSIGKEHDWSWHPYFCAQMHMKGEHYDPNSDETDAYGDPLPVEDGEMCFRKLIDPQDFYELSQVYLGAQYMAQLDKGVGSRAKAAVSKGFGVSGTHDAADLFQKAHILTLNSQEAQALPPIFPAQSKAGAAAGAGINIKHTDEGIYRWTDAEGLVWEFDPMTEDELCLGKSSDEPEETVDDTGDEPAVEEADTGDEDESDTGESDIDEEDDLSKAAVVAAARKAALPTSFVQAAEAANGDGLAELLKVVGTHITELETRVAELAPKAAAGDQFLKELRADTLHWYVMSQQASAGENKGVPTGSIERMLDLAAGDVELSKELNTQYKEMARARFPESVRRSSFPDDANSKLNLPDTSLQVDTEGVRRIHG